MNTNPQNPTNGRAARLASRGDAEETLRLIASLPAPKGLEDRVHRALGEARALRTPRRKGRLVVWPAAPGMGREWTRTAAAAAIAFVIAGGGWGVYREVQPRQTANGIPLVSHGANPGSFAGAGAMRTPQTLNGPVVGPVVGPAAAHPAQAHSTPAKSGKKQGAAQGAPAAKESAAAKAAVQAGAQAAKP